MHSFNVTNPNATTALYMFHDVSATSSFILGRTLSMALGCVLVPIYSLFALIVLKALRKKAQNGKKTQSKGLILGLLLGNLLFSIVSDLHSSIGLNVVADLDPTVCNSWARLGGFTYVMSNFFSYTILLMRAQAVGVVKGSGKIEKVLFKFILTVVKLGTASVPLLALVCVVVFQGKTYFVEEYCVQAITDWVAWLFLFLDSSLSGGYLLLFIMPVMIHMRKMRSVTPVGNEVYAASTNSLKKGSSNDPIKATAIRNLKISSTAITSTFVYMVGVSLVSSFASGGETSILPYVHFNTFQYYGAATDKFVNAMCNMLMTKNLWMPETASTSRKSKVSRGATGTSFTEPSTNQNSGA